MNRNLVFCALTIGLLAISADFSRASEADSLAVTDSLAVVDSLAVPVKRDTIQAGAFTVIGDLEQPRKAGDLSEEKREELKGTLALVGSKETTGLRQWQRRKNAKVAMLSTAVLPGLGQLYNGRRIKVGLAAGFFSYYAAGAWMNWKSAQSWTAYRDNLPEDNTRQINKANEFIDFHKETARDYLWWTGFVWVVCILDSWIDAHLFDLRVYTPPADLGGNGSEAPQLAPFSSSKPLHYVTLSFGF
jgi:hypothetical protein